MWYRNAAIFIRDCSIIMSAFLTKFCTPLPSVSIVKTDSAHLTADVILERKATCFISVYAMSNGWGTYFCSFQRPWIWKFRPFLQVRRSTSGSKSCSIHPCLLVRIYWLMPINYLLWCWINIWFTSFNTSLMHTLSSLILNQCNALLSKPNVTQLNSTLKATQKQLCWVRHSRERSSII